MNYFQRLSKKQIYIAAAVAGPLLITLCALIFFQSVQVSDDLSTDESDHRQESRYQPPRTNVSVMGAAPSVAGIDPTPIPSIRSDNPPDIQGLEAKHQRLLELSVELAEENAHLHNLIRRYDDNLSSPELRERLSQELLDSRAHRENLIERIELKERSQAADNYEP